MWGLITWLLYGWSNWPWFSREGRHPRYTSQFRGQHEYYITTVWIIARRGSFSCFMLPTFRLLFFRCHSCRDVCWLLVRFKAHSLIAYILRVFRVEHSSTLPYSTYTIPPHSAMLLRNWAIFENAMKCHQNLTMSLHCIHFAAKSKVWPICNCGGRGPF